MHEKSNPFMIMEIDFVAFLVKILVLEVVLTKDACFSNNHYGYILSY